MADRTIILHYHVFKNAGTSVDKIFKDNFPGRWVTAEFAGTNNTVQVMDWIKANPKATVFSSHTMMGPLPKIVGIRIISVIMLRDPIARIRSAYLFERKQQSDNFGAVLAKYADFEGYVRVRLSLPHDRQCRNFQTWKLASLVPGPEPELERARRALPQLSVVGQVDSFTGSLEALKTALAEPFPDFHFSSVHANRSHPEAVETSAPREVDDLLKDANRDDLALLYLVRTTVEAPLSGKEI